MKIRCGHLLLGIGTVHLAVGFGFGFDAWTEIVSDGFVGAVEPHLRRMYWFWFAMTGILLLLVGQLTLSMERLVGSLPEYLGWEILVLGLVATAAIPASGGWLVIGAGLYIVIGRRRRRHTRLYS